MKNFEQIELGTYYKDSDGDIVAIKNSYPNLMYQYGFVFKKEDEKYIAAKFTCYKIDGTSANSSSPNLVEKLSENPNIGY